MDDRPVPHADVRESFQKVSLIFGLLRKKLPDLPASRLLLHCIADQIQMRGLRLQPCRLNIKIDACLRVEFHRRNVTLIDRCTVCCLNHPASLCSLVSPAIPVRIRRTIFPSSLASFHPFWP